MLDEHGVAVKSIPDDGLVGNKQKILDELKDLELPAPKPSTLRNTPLGAFSSMRLTNSLWVVVPTLKSPSVARITRLMPPSMKLSTATPLSSVGWSRRTKPIGRRRFGRGEGFWSSNGAGWTGLNVRRGGLVWVRFFDANRVFDSARAGNWVRLASFFSFPQFGGRLVRLPGAAAKLTVMAHTSFR